MPDIPSIKGGVFSLAVEDLSKLLSDDKISQEELERRLEPQDIAYLDEMVSATKWYPIRSYARILALLRDVEGGGSNDYLRGRGARSAETLLQAGLYQQLAYLKRTQLEQENEPRARFLAFGRDLRLLCTLSASILNFGHWESKPDHGIYHAWNKALDHVRGEWICFLGADDRFRDTDSLERIVEVVRRLGYDARVRWESVR